MPEVTRKTSTNMDSDEPSDHPNGFVTYREIDGQRANVRVYNDGRVSGTFPDGSRATSRTGLRGASHSAMFSGGRKEAQRETSTRRGSRMQNRKHHSYARPTLGSVPEDSEPKDPSASANSFSSQVESHDGGADGAGGPTSAPTMTSSQEAESEEARGRRLKAHQGLRDNSKSPGFERRRKHVPNEIAKIHYKEAQFNKQQEKERRH
ncbi:uncharacterized protein N7511_000998 [Penicillium nucicola]|uniref:uncharacterized protein n=1 Tax=Penicillium nucicola TaxID=1850975 RepID=UPI002545B650|nr:uncharacterized protein N7511_000998 [Penicillium nucicola]KAJ5775987.1 hypothetical protein N7511_000998 [Penicillium nucicola]